MRLRVLIRGCWCAFLIMQGVLAMAQEGDDNIDGELWTSARLNVELHERWELKTDHQFRTKAFSTQFDRFLTEYNLEYRLHKRVRVTLASRYIALNDNTGNVQGIEHHLRFHAEAEYRMDFDRLELKHRIRYQHQNELGQSRAEGDFADQDIRYKLSVEYNIPDWKWDPTVAWEVFYHQERGAINGFRRQRLYAGVDRNLPGPNKLGLTYMYEHQQDLWEPRLTHVLVVKFTHTLKRKE